MKYVSTVIPKSFHQLIISCILHAVAMVTVTLTSDTSHLYLVIIPMSMAAMVGKISYQSYVNETVGKKHMAYLIGINGSMNSFCRLSTPVIAGYIMEGFSKALTLYCAAFCTLLASALFVLAELEESRKKSKRD